MMSKAQNLRYELFGAWCAPIFSVMTVVGFLGLARFSHAPSGGLTAEQLDAFYARHHTAMEIGLSLFALGCIPLAIYCVQLGISLWRIERSPLMCVVQVLGGFAVVLLVFISCCLWIGAAYRAGHTNPNVTVALNDASWFGFLVGWIMLALQMIGAGLVTIHDKRDTPLVPRWLSWFSLIGAVALFTANGCVFAKTGIWGWQGVLGFYIPMAIWGTWLDAHAFFVRKEVRRLQAEEAGAARIPSPAAAPEREVAGVA